ncbi:MAG: flagellar basal body-associated FliL family protein [Desulfuromonadaceae bacterium]
MANKPEETTTEEKKGGKLKLILIILGAVLLLVAVGIGAYLLGTSGDKETAQEETETEATEETGPAIGPMIPMDDFIVNILDAEETRYLKISMTLELATPESTGEIEERKAQIRDTILLYLSSKTFDEIRDLQGKLQIRADLVGSINALLTAGKVKTIYFTDFVVQ